MCTKRRAPLRNNAARAASSPRGEGQHGRDAPAETVHLPASMSLLDVFDGNRDYKRVLERTRVGQQVQAHIVSMEHMRMLQGKTPCAQQQSAEMARILLTKLRKNREWLGLPAQLPRVIAFLHLSGENVLVYSDALAILRAIVFAGAAASNHRLGMGVAEITQFAEMHNASLLLTLSLPWQGGTHQQYWEIRTVRQNGEGELVDGEQCFGSRSDEVQEGSSITQMVPPPKRLTDELVRNYEAIVRAVNIDGMGEGEPAPGPTTAAAEKELRTLREAVNGLQAQRKDFQADQRELKQKHTVALRDQAAKAASELAEEHVRLTSAQAERDRAQTELSAERKRGEEERRSLNAELVAKEEELEKAQAKIDGAKELREAALKAERAAVQTLAHERERHTLHLEDFQQGSERRISELTLRVSSISAELAAARGDGERKESVLDGVRAERDAVQYEARQQRRELRCVRGLLAVGVSRIAEEREVAKKKLEDKEKKVRAAEKKAATARKAADEAAAEARRAAKREAEATAVTQTTTDAVADTRSTATACVNTEPQGDPPEVLQMQKLLDEKRAELDELKERLVEAEAKAGSGGAVFGGDPAIDALLEGLAIESRRIHQQLYQSAQGGGVGMASGPPSYEQPGRFYNPMLAPAAYNYYHHQ